MLKINNSGALVWQKSLQIPDFVFEKLKSMAGNRILLAGSCGSRDDFYLLELALNGQLTSKVKFSLNVQGVNSVSDVIQTSDGGFMTTGSLNSPSGRNPSGFFVQLDPSKKPLLQKIFDIGHSHGGSVFEATPGNLMLFGTGKGKLTEDLLVLKVPTSGLTAACTFFRSLDLKSVPFGVLKLSPLQTTVVTPPSIGSTNLPFTSIVTDRHEATLCK
jgi:hypothetical protein